MRLTTRWPRFQVTLNGELIQDIPKPKEAIDAGIRSSMSFVEWEAGTAAGLDMYEWENGKMYSRAFKARTVAWYQLHNMSKLRSEVAAQRKAKKAKRK